MCNAWNHPIGCDCGFGGDTGGGWGWAAGVHAEPAHARWEHWDDDPCHPTSCPVCGAEVFFVRHNGGTVWFDELGPPWPKHACFDDEPAGSRLRGGLTATARAGVPVTVGVVIEAVATEPGRSGRLLVRCSDGTLVDDQFATSLDVMALVGQLVTVARDENGKPVLTPVTVPAATRPAEVDGTNTPGVSGQDGATVASAASNARGRAAAAPHGTGASGWIAGFIPGGIYVERVNAGSPAEIAGIISRDVIIRAADRDTPTLDAFERIRDATPPGGTLDIVVRRGDADMTLTLARPMAPLSTEGG